MKTRIIILSLILFLLSGCSANSTEQKKVQIPSTVVSLSDDQPNFIKTSGIFPSMVSSGTGYYAILGKMNKLLFYTDKESMKTIVVCNKPDCLHAEGLNKEDCNAYLSPADSTDIRDILIYQSNIYYVRSKLDRDQDSYYLTKMSLDGTQRDDVYKFSEFPQNAILHRGYLYYSTTDEGTIDDKEESSVTHSALYRVSLSNLSAAPELICTNDGIYASVFGLLGYKSRVYFQCTKYSDASLKNNERILMSYNTEDKRTERIDENIRRDAICADRLVYTSGNQGKCVCNLDGTDKRIIKDIIGDSNSDDSYILTDTTALFYEGAKNNDGSPVKNAIYTYDMDGKLLQSFDLSQYNFATLIGSDHDSIFVTTSTEENNRQQDFWKIEKSKIPAGSAEMVKYFSYKD